MTSRNAILFLKSKPVAVLGFFAVCLTGFFVIQGFSTPTDAVGSMKDYQPEPTNAEPFLVRTVNRYMVPFLTLKANEDPSGSGRTETKGGKKPEDSMEMLPISLVAEVRKEKAPEALLEYAPYGRLIQCELVVTVDSSSSATPIIGLVTDDVFHQGRLIIPAGTEVHGAGKVDKVRQRMASSGDWTLVWQSGQELNLTGFALDRDPDLHGQGWSITDGSAGLRGDLIKSEDVEEIRLFAGSFLKGWGRPGNRNEKKNSGSQGIPNSKNVPFLETGEELNGSVQQILNTVQRDGFYVRVPAGKPFYLYVTQTIDRREAKLGSSRVGQALIAAEEEKVKKIATPAAAVAPTPTPVPPEVPEANNKP